MNKLLASLRQALLCLCLLLLPTYLFAQKAPQPPCGTDPFPAWPLLDQQANVKSWSRSETGNEWRPPACTGWFATGFTSLVTTAARFRFPLDSEALLRHAGAISQLAGMRYWSTTHQQWRTLVNQARALTGPPAVRPRADFSPDEMKAGAVLYFEQNDNLTGKGVYRLHIAEATPDRIVYDIENTGTLRYFLVPVMPAGEMQSVTFLDREQDNVWRYYSIVRTGKHTNHLATSNESSAINRAVAFYRSLAGIPSAQEPPAAR